MMVDQKADHQQSCCCEADGVDEHDGHERRVGGEGQLYLGNAYAAYADHREDGGGE